MGKQERLAAGQGKSETQIRLAALVTQSGQQVGGLFQDPVHVRQRQFDGGSIILITMRTLQVAAVGEMPLEREKISGAAQGRAVRFRG
jgi:hypothetical protein